MTNTKELAIFGGKPLFQNIRSTSNLVQPDADRFFYYARQSYDAGWLTNNGPMVRLLEQRLAELHGTEFCIATCNGLWALVLCVYSLALKGKKEVIMPSFTYRRLADIAAWLKMVPYFCDVNEISLGIDVESAERAINDNTALILAAHPIVNLCNIDGFVNLSQKYGIPLMFDAVEAAYASHGNKMVGSFGQAECFSMHASKFLNGFEAGYITTNNESLAKKLQKMRAFGFYGPDQVEEFGLNAKLNEFHAAMALAAMDDLSDQVERNLERFKVYREQLDGVKGIELVEYDETEKRTFKNILIRLTNDWPLSRSQTLEILHAENLLARPYYSPPLHDKKTDYPTLTGEMTNTDVLKHQFLLLPSGEFLDTHDIRKITDFLRVLSRKGEEIVSKLVGESS